MPASWESKISGRWRQSVAVVTAAAVTEAVWFRDPQSIVEGEKPPWRMNRM